MAKKRKPTRQEKKLLGIIDDLAKKEQNAIDVLRDSNLVVSSQRARLVKAHELGAAAHERLNKSVYEKLIQYYRDNSGDARLEHIMGQLILAIDDIAKVGKLTKSTTSLHEQWSAHWDELAKNFVPGHPVRRPGMVFQFAEQIKDGCDEEKATKEKK